MRQKTYPKASFLGSFFGFKPLLVISLGVLFLTQSSSAADDGDDDSKSPAKRGVKFEKEEDVDSRSMPEVVDFRKLFSSLDYSPNEEKISKIIEYLSSDRTKEDLQIIEYMQNIEAFKKQYIENIGGLLETLDHKPAEDGLNEIIQYLSYIRNKENTKAIRAIKRQVIKSLKQKGTYNENLESEDFEGFLLERAWNAITTGPLQPYLGELLDKNKGLKEIVKKLEVENKKLQEAIMKLLEQIVTQQEENSNLYVKLSEQSMENHLLKKYLWAGIPLTCMLTCTATVFVIRFLQKK